MNYAFVFIFFLEKSAMKNCLHFKSLRGGAAAAPGLWNEGKKDHDVRARAPQTRRTGLCWVLTYAEAVDNKFRSAGRDFRIFQNRTEAFFGWCQSSRQQVPRCWNRLPNVPKLHWGIFRVVPKRSTKHSKRCCTTPTDVQIDLQSPQRFFRESYPRKLTLVNYESRIEEVPENDLLFSCIEYRG